MKRNFIILLVVFCTTASYAQKKSITLEDIWAKGTFQSKNIPGFKGTDDGLYYTTTKMDGDAFVINKTDLATGSITTEMARLSLKDNQGKTIKPSGYKMSKTGERFLALANGKQIFRHSSVYDVYVYDTKTQSTQKVAKEKILHATLNPQGTQVAYVSHNNLYLYDIASQQTKAITTDGQYNAIINGSCDWVYEEEFGFTQAFQWSKDGAYIAYYKFDESKVPMYTMTMYDSLYPRPYTFKYPKAGDVNSVVNIYCYQVSSGITKTLHHGGSEQDEYVPRIQWVEQGNKVCISLLNRHQNKLQLKMVNADALYRGMYASKITEIVYTESNPYFINVNDHLNFLKDGQRFLIQSEQSGFNRIYIYDMNTKKAKALTPNNYDVAAITGVDEKAQMVYYTAATPTPMDRKLFGVHFNTGKITRLTPENGTHNITPINGQQYFLDSWTTLHQVPKIYLRDAKGKVVRVMEENKALEEKLKEYDLGKIQLVKVKGTHDMLNAWMITPPDFDSTKSYPLLMFQYSGPNSQQVADKFPVGDFFWHQMLAQKGYVVLCADGTGTGFRGQEFAKKTYLQLGKYESDDQIAVAKFMGAKSWIDESRIGIWGWSYGGFMSSTCLMKGNDVFKMAIAVAPVTNWKYYDNIYTERYMRTPQENKDGYEQNAPENMAAQLKGNLLLIHGTGDDNVHFQNSVMLTKKLIEANKQFDTEYFPDKAHGIGGGVTRLQLYTRMTRYIQENL